MNNEYGVCVCGSHIGLM